MGQTGGQKGGHDHRVFDRRLVRARRDRAAAGFGRVDFLVREFGERVLERLETVNRRFPAALDLGCHTGEIGRLLTPERRAALGIETLVECDLSPAMAGRAGPRAVVADEEALPFGAESFDLIVSCLSLHWVNDLPGALVQVRRALKPDGLFVCSMLGAGTLGELRQALMDAEMEVDGGLSPRVSPFADVRDLGGLLQRAGFALPVADSETVKVRYAHPLALMDEVRRMGEANATLERRTTPTARATLMRAAELYAERFRAPDGRIPATFTVLTMTGWAPHESQQQPLRPGSAATRLADALGTLELPANDPAPPQRRRN